MLVHEAVSPTFRGTVALSARIPSARKSCEFRYKNASLWPCAKLAGAMQSIATHPLLSPSADDLFGQRFSVVDRSQRLRDRRRADRYGSRLIVGVGEIPDQRLDVAVEDQADDFRVLVDHGASRVAADDVGRRHEIKR